jgi:hypothetical protein
MEDISKEGEAEPDEVGEPVEKYEKMVNDSSMKVGLTVDPKLRKEDEDIQVISTLKK